MKAYELLITTNTAVVDALSADDDVSFSPRCVRVKFTPKKIFPSNGTGSLLLLLLHLHAATLVALSCHNGYYDYYLYAPLRNKNETLSFVFLVSFFFFCCRVSFIVFSFQLSPNRRWWGWLWFVVWSLWRRATFKGNFLVSNSVHIR